jgi:hypothetical protein
MNDIIIKQIERLTGYPPPISNKVPVKAIDFLIKKKGLGYSQFNEVLLVLGYDRIPLSFFQYLVDGRLEYKDGCKIDGIDNLKKGVERFVILALRAFGNVSMAYRQFSFYVEDLERLVHEIEDKNPSIGFEKRNKEINGLITIDELETFLLGFLKNTDGIDEKLLAKTENVQKDGFLNHKSYLASDHMDVYIATSMREPIHFININKSVEKIFEQECLVDLKLRYFNPTQAFCPERIDKGLSEALMLKRAKCTIYFAQETETFGKDSELASTLAQGKPVIAFVPMGDDEFVKDLIDDHFKIYTGKNKVEVLLEILRLYGPELAWKDKDVISWIKDNGKADIDKLIMKISVTVKDYYNKRAESLMQTHPLGIQVYLDTGVANGVLVVRSEKKCGELVRAIILNDLEFTLKSEIKEVFDEENEYIYLHENISNSIYRVMSGDKLLTNAFWNFYLVN